MKEDLRIWLRGQIHGIFPDDDARLLVPPGMKKVFVGVLIVR